KNDALSALFDSHKVRNLEEAQEAHDKFLEAANAVRSGEALLLSALQPGETLEALEKAAAASAAGAGRDPSLVQAELASLTKDLAGKKEGLVRASSLLQDFERRHGAGDSRALMQRMV